MKINWKLFLGAILFIIIEGFIFIDLKDLSISDKIQAGSIIALVFVTLYYAIQTYMLVKEAKKKRDADFWERRIAEFYKPFIVKLNTMRDEINVETLSAYRTEEISIDTQNFLWEKRYMVSKDTFNKINELHSKLFIVHTDVDKAEELLREFREAESKVRTIIVNECKSLEASIRKIYGY